MPYKKSFIKKSYKKSILKNSVIKKITDPHSATPSQYIVQTGPRKEKSPLCLLKCHFPMSANLTNNIFPHFILNFY